MFNVIKNILGGLLYVILFLFTGVQACVAGVNANSKAYTQEERIAFFNENRACFEELASSGFAETKNVTSGMGKTNVHTIERKTKVKMDAIEDCVEDDIVVYYRDKDNYVEIDFITAPAGFSESGLYYSESGLSMVPASGTLTEYDADIDKNVAYFNASYVEVYQIDEHWFYFHKAFYNNDGFRRKSE